MTFQSRKSTDIPGRTLVTGGTGKTGRRVTERLQARGVETRIAARGTWGSVNGEQAA